MPWRRRGCEHDRRRTGLRSGPRAGGPMRLPLPTRRYAGAWAVAAGFAALARLIGVPPALIVGGATASAFALLSAAVRDLLAERRLWRDSPLTLHRRLPAALALGVARELPLVFGNPAGVVRHVTVFDHPDGRLGHAGLPLALALPPGATVEARYTLHPLQRGLMRFAPAELRVATPWRLFEVRRTLGGEAGVRVYPDFAQVARYAWLAGDRRLSEIGIKSFTQRGEGTDFKELAEYRPGDDTRHIDWRASLRLQRPVVREFQDERDQCVLFLLDCGRRMRAAEDDPLHGGHFDHALNATMLLAYVALASGDEVGAMTYGSAPGDERFVAPRKGRATLHTLMAALYDVQPQPETADLQAAAQALMRRHPRRALVVLITNFRDEDADEVAPALALLRSRHLVLLASLRERALREAVEQPLAGATAARRIAAAHALAQDRQDAFRRLAARDALLVDAEPSELPAALVNRYHAVKRAGLL